LPGFYIRNAREFSVYFLFMPQQEKFPYVL